MYLQQVCIQPPALVVNVTLPAFAAECQCLLDSAVQ